jgi:hypothetical protein
MVAGEEQAALKDAARLLLVLGMAEKVEVTAQGETRQLDPGQQDTLKLAAGLLRRIAGLEPGVRVKGRA